ncbi:glycosyltransferase [Flavobacterium amniphilum]|uniref:glycosyltransferase n=1 Tax=Flavobacterium amniphilum TaxID=1834035 RepID=UPI002029D803|nr:glycosyltransferase [Flavobacterium amniphilum]MCL9805134.1 glycosyltransferase [Flavobacterium amniphilum]
MRILFLYSCLPLGGIETFLVRMIKQLHGRNIPVTVLFFTHKFDEGLLNELKQYATVCHWDDYVYAPRFFKKGFPILKLLFPLRIDKLKREILSNVTHIHAPDTNSMLFSARLLKLNPGINLTTGVYHINEFNVKTFTGSFFGKKINEFLQKLPSQNITFYSEMSRSFYESGYDGKFGESNLVPIGINLEKYEGCQSGVQNKRVVSIGRLTAWKKYNFQMIEIIKSMNKKGVFLHYDSYGDGIEREKLEQIVKEERLEKQIIFHSGVPYHLFKETINDSLMFIGAGTALIEASACAIPAMIGIENEQDPVTYGFLHNTHTYSYQEKGLDYPVNFIETYIDKLLNQSKDEYEEECNKARKRAFDFSIQKSEEVFCEMIKNSRNFKFTIRWTESLFFVISLSMHLIMSKIKGTYGESFFKRL